jgi:hypothetical protein
MLVAGLSSIGFLGATVWVAKACPVWDGGTLSSSARDLWRAVGSAFLEGNLPAAGPARQISLAAWLARLESTLSALPERTQGDVHTLTNLLLSGPGRWALTGVRCSLTEVSTPVLQDALQGMRMSSLDLRQQAYQAMHDLTGAAYYSDPETWGVLGYPGPVPV